MAKKRKTLQRAPVERVERWPVAKLVPYAQNPRTHSPKQIEQIAASMKEFGQAQLVVVDEKGIIIAGHGRVLAAQQLGWETISVGIAVGWSEPQKRAYRIADNQIALTSAWDNEFLSSEVEGLKFDEFDLSLLGFDRAELARFTAGATDPEATPAPSPDPIVHVGDLWILGEHRLLCGDCTSKESVKRLLGEDRPHLMVTDPPYGVDYDPAWRTKAKGPDGRRLSKGDVSMGDFNDALADWSEAWKLFPGDVAYVWHGALTSSAFEIGLANAGFVLRSVIVWVKQQIVIGRGDYHWQHEPCFYAVRKGRPGRWAGDRKQSTVWEINNHSGGAAKDDGATAHSTQKPIECMKRPIENNSRSGEAIYEPFSGSGTTIIAAEMTARRCMAIDIDPVYVQVAIERWQKFTGKQAALEGTGRTFEAIAAERKKGKGRHKGSPSVTEAALDQAAR